MRCWRCWKDNTEGTVKCLYCGTVMKRNTCITEEGEAFRTLYDQYGLDVFSQKSCLCNGLGDYLPDSSNLRSQLKMALDAGIGELYLRQLSEKGIPDPGFNKAVKRMITENAGLSDQVAERIIGYFDEMIGWEEKKVTATPTAPVKQEMSPADVPPKPSVPAAEPPKKSSKREIIIALLFLILTGIISFLLL